MRNHPEFQSGTWTGFYLEPHRSDRGWMHLYLNCDEQGKILGEGIDYVGPWTLTGIYDGDTRRCRWTKSYVGRHRVEYAGELDGEGVRGEWRINEMLTGEFHIWPTGQTHIHDAYLRAPAPQPFAPTLIIDT